ncbi:MAG: hypothetical protein GVY36_17255 [Verrucomicrobia bacterium]|jgi:hypothetical protein|nr:hypothetical protein [Verrucomicrobiota bacterium]
MAIDRLDKLRDSFKDTLDKDVKSIIRLHGKDEGSAGRPGDWLKAIRRASVVLLAANLENYIESLVCAAFQELEANDTKATRYPENYRLWLFRKTANNRNLGNVEAKDVIEASLKLYSEVRELKKAELRLDDLRDQFANPTASNINWIISLLDRADYLDGMEIEVNGAATSATSALGELANRRNEVAHGNVSQDPQIDDIERLSKFCQLFSTRIKKDVTTTIETILKK